MRRILVVDNDLHTRLAIRTWLMQCAFRVVIADGGANGLAALDDSTFDLMIVDIFMPNMRGFRVDQDISSARADGPVFRTGNRQSGLPQNGAWPWSDAVPAQTLQAGDIAQRDRRMSVASRAAPEIYRNACRRRRAVRIERGARPRLKANIFASVGLT